jgi:5-methylcytosine-specific restriction protein A
MGVSPLHKNRTSRNRSWERDEIILALDLYMECRPNFPGPADPRIVGLSAFLNQLAQILGAPAVAKFRNPNGVAMKLQNLRRFDPGQHGKGLSAGGRLEAEVWAAFADSPDRLRRTALAIRTSLKLLPGERERGVDLVTEAEEGAALTRIHLARERNRVIVESKKAEVLGKLGRLACEACTFDFSARYGQRGEGFIECHHTAALSDGAQPRTTRLSDLVLLCANCHRMIHVRRPWLTLGELCELVGVTPV